MKEQKKFLLAEIDKAIEGAPDAKLESELHRGERERLTVPLVESGIPIGRNGSVEANARIAKDNASKFGYVTVEVPGDGEYKLLNAKPVLEAFKKRAESRFPTLLKTRPEALKKFASELEGKQWAASVPREPTATKATKPKTRKTARKASIESTIEKQTEAMKPTPKGPGIAGGLGASDINYDALESLWDRDPALAFKAMMDAGIATQRLQQLWKKAQEQYQSGQGGDAGYDAKVSALDHIAGLKQAAKLPKGPGIAGGPGAAAAQSGGEFTPRTIPAAEATEEEDRGPSANATGLRRSVAVPEAAALGIPPEQKADKRPGPEVKAEAEAVMMKDPEAAQKLIDELTKRPRPLSDLEVAILTLEKVRRFNARNEAATVTNKAAASGTEAEQVAARMAYTTASERLEQLWSVVERGNEKSITMTARGLAAVGMMLDEKYNLVQMEQDLRAKKGNKGVSEEELAELRAIADAWEKRSLLGPVARGVAEEKQAQAESERDQAEREREDMQVEAETSVTWQELLEEMFPNSKQRSRILAKIEAWGDQQIAEADAMMKELRGLAGAGVTDRHLLVAGKYGAGYIAKGFSKFSAWAAKMRETFKGIDIESHLQQIFTDARKAANLGTGKVISGEKRGTGKKPTPEAPVAPEGEEKQKLDHAYIKELYEAQVAHKVTELEEATRNVTDIAREIDTKITEREVKRLFSNYDAPARTASKDHNKRVLAQLEQEALVWSKYDDAMAGIRPRKRGTTMQKPSLEWFKTKRKLNAEMKKHPDWEDANPEQQQASAMRARQTALENEIRLLDDAMAKGERLTDTGEVMPDSEEVKLLRAKRDDRKALYDAMFPPVPKSDEQKLTAAIAVAERQLAAWEKKAQNAKVGVFNNAMKKDRSVWNERLSNIKNEVAARRAEVEALKEIAFPKLTPEQKFIRGKQRAAKRAIEDMNLRMKHGVFDRNMRYDPELKTFAPRSKPSFRLSQAPEVLAAEQAKQDVKDRYNLVMGKAWWESLSPPEQAAEIAKGSYSMLRNIVFSIDNSALGRQGWTTLLTHPWIWAEAVAPSFQAAKRSNSAVLNAQVNERENHQNGLDQLAELEIQTADGRGDFNGNDDNTKIDVMRKIPLLKRVVAPGVDVSTRMYATALNTIRGGLFDTLMKSSPEGRAAMAHPENLTAEEKAFVKDVGKLVNMLTGISQLKHADAAAKYFAAPRFLKSLWDVGIATPIRLTAALPIGAASRLMPASSKLSRSVGVVSGFQTKAARKAARNQYYRMIGTLSVMYMLASLFDHDIEWDPRSSSFGNIHIGKYHTLNLLGPYKPLLVLLSRLASGQTKSGDKMTRLRPGKLPFGTAAEQASKMPYGRDLLDVMVRFGQSRLHPAMGLALASLTRKTWEGKPAGPLDLARMGIPLSMLQTPEMFARENLSMGSLFAVANFLGFPVGVDWEKKQAGEKAAKAQAKEMEEFTTSVGKKMKESIFPTKKAEDEEEPMSGTDTFMKLK